MEARLFNLKNKTIAKVEVPFTFGDKPETHPDVLLFKYAFFYRYVTNDGVLTYRQAVFHEIIEG